MICELYNMYNMTLKIHSANIIHNYTINNRVLIYYSIIYDYTNVIVYIYKVCEWTVLCPMNIIRFTLYYHRLNHYKMVYIERK